MRYALVALGLLLAGCAQGPTLLAPDEFAGTIESEDLFVIDVHVPEQKHIQGTDAFIPYDEIMRRVDEIPDDRPISVYCRSGSMSAQAAQELSEIGYDVYDLDGGVHAWRAAGLPMEQ